MDWSIFTASGQTISFDKPAVMAIMNATPDSFSDGGTLNKDNALNKRVKYIVDSGAEIIDVGGESTRPAHIPVSGSEEVRRVVRVIEAIRAVDEYIPISIDTQKPTVASVALKAGADFVNDVSGLSSGSFADFVAGKGCSVILMRHKALKSDNLLNDCNQQMLNLISNAKKHGIDSNRIILDPGLGFGDLLANNFSLTPGSDPASNLELVTGLKEYSYGLPVLIGASRKRFVGDISNEENAGNRIKGSVATAIIALQSGAQIVRAHDIRATVQARDIMLSL